MKKRTILILCCAGLALAMGAAPRYLEELRIGGGLGDGIDGGADFDRAGNIATDGDIACGAISANTGAIGTLTGLGALQAGAADASAGLVQVFGGTDTQGGRIRLYNGHASDGAVDYWTTGCGSSGRFELGGAGGTNSPGTFFQFDPISNTAAFLDPTEVWSGAFSAGRAGTEPVQGVITACSGGSGAAPGCLKLHSCNGTPSYVFATDDGIGLRISSSPPGSNTAGAWPVAGRFRGTGSTTDAVDLATSEVAGLLPSSKVGSGLADAQITDALTVWGGAINSTPIGASFASSGRFSSLTLTGVLQDDTITTWPADSCTPNVTSGNLFRVPSTWSSGVYVTGFVGGVVGQRILVVGGDTDCVFLDSGSLKLSANWLAGPSDTLELLYDGMNWCEISRSNN